MLGTETHHFFLVESWKSSSTCMTECSNRGVCASANEGVEVLIRLYLLVVCVPMDTSPIKDAARIIGLLLLRQGRDQPSAGAFRTLGSSRNAC